jgi:hypothetical protein
MPESLRDPEVDQELKWTSDPDIAPGDLARALAQRLISMASTDHDAQPGEGGVGR